MDADATGQEETLGTGNIAVYHSCKIGRARSATLFGVLNTLATTCCKASPSTGSTSKFSFFASSRNSAIFHRCGESLAQRFKSLLRHARRCRQRAAQLRSRDDQFDELTILAAFRQVLD